MFNVVLLFTGLGLGSITFGLLPRVGFTTALLAYAAAELVLTVLGVALFHDERPAEAS